MGVLISPGETFESIARQPDFWVPVILIVVVSLAAGIILAQRVDFVAPMREQMEERGAPQSQIESTVRFMTPFFKGISYGSPILAIIFLLIIASTMLLAFRAMGGEGDFRQAFSVTRHPGRAGACWPPTDRSTGSAWPAGRRCGSRCPRGPGR